MSGFWLIFGMTAAAAFSAGFSLAIYLVIAAEVETPHCRHQPAADSISRLNDRIARYKKCVAVLCMLLCAVIVAAAWMIWL